MDPTQCKQLEMDIVDDILGNLPSDRSRSLHRHLTECRACQKLYVEWRELLKDDISAEPSARLYKHLKTNFLCHHFKRKFLRPATIWGAASVALVLTLMLALITIQSKQPLDPLKQLPMAAENIPPFVIDNTETVQYLIDPQEGQLASINGIIWVNSHLDEIYCYVQNLEYNACYDYQIWLIKPIKREIGGLLQIMDEYGELHLNQRNIQEIQQISISLEPKGGSLYPTTGDTILVDFNLK